MRRALICVVAAAAAVTLGRSAGADPTGTLNTTLYGTTPVATQLNPTGFGDDGDGTVDWAHGSELDAAYAAVSGGNLNLFFAGNLESNYNHLEVFIDSVHGGVQTIPHTNADIDYNALGRMGANDGTDPNAPAASTIGPGLTFDKNFKADLYTEAAGGDNGTGTYTSYINYATIPTSGPGVGAYAGGIGTVQTEPTSGIKLAINNSNTGGVTGTTADPTAIAAVNTGIEFQIPLATLSNPIGAVKVTAFVNGSGHDYVSNQVLGSLPAGYGNMGEPRTLDFSAQPGNQYFIVYLNTPGDANADGKIGPDDYALLDRGFAKYQSGAIAPYDAQWTDGDFNVDGVVDASDYLLIDQNFIKQGGTFSAAMVAEREAQFGAGYMSSLIASVPEPGSLGVVAAAGLLALKRRRA